MSARRVWYPTIIAVFSNFASKKVPIFFPRHSGASTIPIFPTGRGPVERQSWQSRPIPTIDFPQATTNNAALSSRSKHVSSRFTHVGVGVNRVVCKKRPSRQTLLISAIIFCLSFGVAIRISGSVCENVPNLKSPFLPRKKFLSFS